MPKKKGKSASQSVEPKQPPKPMGRPTKYTAELGALICKVVSTTSDGLRTMCRKNPEFPTAETIRVWRLDISDFSALYAKAKLVQADILAEECLDIADDDSRDIKINDDGYEVFNGEFAARSRIRIDTRKWLASKLLPKQYGEAKELQDAKDKNEELKEEIRLLRAKLDAENKRDY